MTLLNGFSYSFSIIAPAGSGFVQSVLNNLSVSGPTNLGVILQFPDTTAPRILSGPLVTHIAANSATVEWQTDEPTTGGANWGTGTASETGYATAHAVAITGLNPSSHYTVTVSATDWAGNGPVTASIGFDTSASGDTTAPVFVVEPTVSAISSTGATVDWQTDEPATTVIGGDLAASVPGLATAHHVELTGLLPLTAYNLVVSSSDGAGNGPTFRTLRFTTLDLPDLNPPVIVKGPWMLAVGADNATVAWETDEPATSGVSYNDGTAYGVLSDANLTREHQVAITGLTSDTLYQATVSSTDGLGNGPSLSSPITFRTLDLTDTTAPVIIEGPSACDLGDRLILLCLRTNEPASLVVEYGLAPEALSQTAAHAGLETRHSLSIGGLTPGTTYYFRATVRDQAGNARSSAIVQATTRPTPAGPPVFISGPAVTYLGNDRVVIVWETDRPAAGLVEYDLGGATLRVENGTPQKSQNLVVPNLEPNTSYQFHVTAIGSDGQQTVVVVTAATPDTLPPVISGLGVRPLPGGFTEVYWNTNEAADSRINFGDSPGLLNRVAGDLDYVRAHAVRLAGLVPGTTYYYQVTSVDPAGNSASSAVGDFVAALPRFTLSLGRSGTGTGTLSGGGTFDQGTLVSPAAQAAGGSALIGWTPASCAAPFALSADTNCIARFDLLQAVAGDLDGDSDVDDADYTVFRGALGACTGAARYRAPADYDSDGCVTTKDYRTWYAHFRSYLSTH